MMKKHPFARMRNRLEIGKFDEWQKEGFQIASTKLYPPSLKFGEMPSEDYKKMAFETAQEQIALAGYRLGEMMNQIFDNQPTAAEQTNKDKNKSFEENKEANRVIGKGANDVLLRTKITAALQSTNDLNNSAINIDVENAVVTLNGIVSSKKQKEIALKVAKSVDGVSEVKNLLKVSLTYQIIE
jgi:osmotically-inducible protein OsmY